MEIWFSDSDKARLKDAGYTLSYDLVGDVAYRRLEGNQYEILWPDDTTIVKTDDIETWLGTG